MIAESPFVTIIIPCYNVEKYIEGCITSVLKQSFSDWECIVINDGSKDNTWELIQKTTSGDNRFSSYNQENKGLSETRNLGIDLAKGEFIYFLDADDIIPENCLEDLSNAVEKNTDIITGITVTVTGELLQKTSTLQHPKEGNIIFKNDNYEVFIRTVSVGLAPVAQNRLFKRSFVEENNLRFEKGIYHEDELWFFETMFFARNVKFINKETYLYRTDNSSSITNTLGDKNLKSYLEILEIIYQNYYCKITNENKKATVARYISYFKKLFIDFSILEQNRLSENTITEMMESLRKTNISADSYKILHKKDEEYYRALEKLSLFKFPVIQKYFFKNPVNSIRKKILLFRINHL